MSADRRIAAARVALDGIRGGAAIEFYYRLFGAVGIDTDLVASTLEGLEWNEIAALPREDREEAILRNIIEFGEFQPEAVRL